MEFWNKSFEIPPKGGAPPSRNTLSSTAQLNNTFKLKANTLPLWSEVFEPIEFLKILFTATDDARLTRIRS